MNKKISEFNQITTRNNNDWLLIEEASTGAYKRIKVSDFIANLGGTTTGDPHWNNTVALMHLNGNQGSTNFTDVKGKTVTRSGDVIISTAQSKFGGASAYFDGSGDGLSVAASSDFSFGLSNLTIELFIYPTNLTGYRQLMGSGGYATPSSGSWRLYSNGSALELWQATPNVRLINGGNLAVNTWHHVAITQESGVLKLWLNGNLINSYTNTINWNDGGSNGLTIGGTAFSFSGYIDELRVTKGICRYTNTFTPPNTAFLDS
jgi:Concanavalin A-like lectin/glucanases superfamily